MGDGELSGAQSCVRFTLFSHHPRRSLQFRFNVKEVEMGTRRPLIVQMVSAGCPSMPRPE